MNAISVEKVSMIYKNPRVEPVVALQHVDCVFKRGESYAITGESGAGKSTLLNLLAGLLSPTEGKVVIMDKDWAQMSDWEQSKVRSNHIGMVVQNFALIEHISVLENCMMAAILAGKGKKYGRKRAEELLDSLGLTDYQKIKASYLSGGQRQRVAIARALMNEPEIILADEPTGALDSVTAMQAIKTLLSATKKESTVILVTHNVSYADLCDHHYVIRDGVMDT